MSKRKVWNLYDDVTIASKKDIFNIYKTEDIEEFWLYFQEHSIIQNEEIIQIVIEYLFKYTSDFLTKVESFDVIIEHAKNMQYITFWHQNHTEMLQQTYVEIQKYNYFNMKINEDKTTFQIIKVDEVTPEINTTNEPLQDRKAQESIKKLTVYEFLSKDDLISMQEINDELLNQMFYISSAQVDEDKIGVIIGELDTYLSIFNKYKELYAISQVVLSFRDVLDENMMLIIENSNNDLNILFEGIISNLKNWTDMSFIKGIEDINYYNDSLNSDISMITNFLNIGENTDFNDDDIFF